MNPSHSAITSSSGSARSPENNTTSLSITAKRGISSIGIAKPHAQRPSTKSLGDRNVEISLLNRIRMSIYSLFRCYNKMSNLLDIQVSKLTKFIDLIESAASQIGQPKILHAKVINELKSVAQKHQGIADATTNAADKAKFLKKAAEAFGKAGMHKESAQEYSKADMHKESGEEYSKAGMHKKAAEEFAKAGMHGEAGEEYSKAGMHGKAAEEFAKTRLHKRAGEEFAKAEIHGEAGEEFAEAGMYEEAAEEYEKAGMHEKAGDAFTEVYMHEKSADAFARAGMHEKSAEAYEKAGMHGEAAKEFAKFGMYEKAAEAYEKAGMYKELASLKFNMEISKIELTDPITHLKSRTIWNQIANIAAKQCFTEDGKVDVVATGRLMDVFNDPKVLFSGPFGRIPNKVFIREQILIILKELTQPRSELVSTLNEANLISPVGQGKTLLEVMSARSGTQLKPSETILISLFSPHRQLSLPTCTINSLINNEIRNNSVRLAKTYKEILSGNVFHMPSGYLVRQRTIQSSGCITVDLSRGKAARDAVFAGIGTPDRDESLREEGIGFFKSWRI